MRDQLPKAGLFVLRAVIGLVFAGHGWKKFVGDDAGKIVENLRAFASYLESVKVPAPEATAWFVSTVYLLCGLLLLLGVASRLQAALLAAVIGTATFYVHLGQGFFQKVVSGQIAGAEYALVMLAACVCLALAGGGMLELFAFPKGRGAKEGAKK